jgi:hypothetical protein
MLSSVRCSGSRSCGSARTPRMAVIMLVRSNVSPFGRVRPPVSAYGRTMGPASWSSHLSSSPGGMAGHFVSALGLTGLESTARCSPTRLTRIAIS